MISVDLLRKVLERRLNFELVAVYSDIWVFVERTKKIPLVFQEPREGRVSVQFLIMQAERLGAQQLVQELKEIEQRLYVLNS